MHENRSVNEGSRVRLTCTSNGGNPLPEIEWKVNGQKIGASSTRTSLNMIESNLDLVLERSHHNQVVECASVNKVNTLRRQVKLNVSCKCFLSRLVSSLEQLSTHTPSRI